MRPRKGWEEEYKLILRELEISAALHLRITEMLVRICSWRLFSPVPLLVGLLPELDQLSNGFASLNFESTPVVDPTASLSNLLTFFSEDVSPDVQHEALKPLFVPVPIVCCS